MSVLCVDSWHSEVECFQFLRTNRMNGSSSRIEAVEAQCLVCATVSFRHRQFVM